MLQFMHVLRAKKQQLNRRKSKKRQILRNRTGTFRRVRGWDSDNQSARRALDLHPCRPEGQRHVGGADVAFSVGDTRCTHTRQGLRQPSRCSGFWAPVSERAGVTALAVTLLLCYVF